MASLSSRARKEEALRPAHWPTWPVFPPDERAAVDTVLASGKVNYWTGQETRKFEEEYAA